jgi:hypothetical protein
MSHRSDITLLREVALTISLYLLKWLQGPSSQWSCSYLYWCTWCYSTYSVKIILRGLLRVWNYSLLPMLWQACQLKEHMTLANYSPAAQSVWWTNDCHRIPNIFSSLQYENRPQRPHSLLLNCMTVHPHISCQCWIKQRDITYFGLKSYGMWCCATQWFCFKGLWCLYYRGLKQTK